MEAKSPTKPWITYLFVFPVIFILSACNNFNESGKKDMVPVSKGAQQDISELNIDPVKISPEVFKILLDNEHVRVVQYSLKPGGKDDWHTHPGKSSYVVSGGKLKVHLENGEIIIADEKTGTASWMDYVGRHYVENIGKTTVTIVFTEIK
ncbi:MAG: hypothetical protein ABIV51_01340 [Saprospiraceae bacterium]